jgi:hypothetical protein
MHAYYFQGVKGHWCWECGMRPAQLRGQKAGQHRHHWECSTCGIFVYSEHAKGPRLKCAEKEFFFYLSFCDSLGHSDPTSLETSNGIRTLGRKMTVSSTSETLKKGWYIEVFSTTVFGQMCHGLTFETSTRAL